MRKFYLLYLITRLSAQGSVMLVGGNAESYGGWSDDPYGWFVQQADSGKIVNIDVSEASDWYPAYFINLGADSSSHELQIPNIFSANSQNVYHDLVTANGIFIEGGDQWDYVQTWKGTLVDSAIHVVFNNGGVIGGTSAGLAILGEIVFDAENGSLTSDQAIANPYHPRILSLIYFFFFRPFSQRGGKAFFSILGVSTFEINPHFFPIFPRRSLP